MNKLDKFNVIKAIQKRMPSNISQVSRLLIDCGNNDNLSELTSEADNDWKDLQEQLKRKSIDHIDWYKIIQKPANTFHGYPISDSFVIDFFRNRQ